MAEPNNKTHVFLCYRQVDGSTTAHWLYQHLHGQPVSDSPSSPVLDLYFDQGAPATADWIAIHGPSLEQAKALLFVCTPGAFSRVTDDDWVHRELAWWITNRDTPPIVIDTTGDGDRWIPAAIKKKWPNCQRVLCRPAEWTDAERAANTQRIRQQIIDGIRLSESGVLFEEVVEQKRLLRQTRRILFATGVVGVLAAIGLFLALRLNSQLIESDARLKAASDSLIAVNYKMQEASRQIIELKMQMIEATERLAASVEYSAENKKETDAQLDKAQIIVDLLDERLNRLERDVSANPSEKNK